MKYTRIDIEIDGHKIICTNNPMEASNKDLFETNKIECSLVVENKYAWCLVPKDLLNVIGYEKFLLKMLLKEIERI